MKSYLFFLLYIVMFTSGFAADPNQNALTAWWQSIHAESPERQQARQQKLEKQQDLMRQLLQQQYVPPSAGSAHQEACAIEEQS